MKYHKWVSSQLATMCVAFLVMLAVAGTASAIPTSYSEFVFFSGGDLTIGGHTVINGDIGSNQNLFLQGNPLPGYPAQLNGSAYAGGNLTFGQDRTVGSSSGPLREVVANGAASIGGDAFIYGNLYGDDVTLGQGTSILQVLGVGGNVQYTTSYNPSGGGTPSVVQGTVTTPSSLMFGTITMTPAASFTATGTNQLVAITGSAGDTNRGDRGFLELAPGPESTYGSLATQRQYQTVRLYNNGTSGDYYFSSITTQGTFTLEIDLTNGPVNINVVGDANFGAADPLLMVKDASTGGLFVPISERPELARLINWNILGKFTLGGGDYGASPYDYTSIWGGIVYSSLAGEGILVEQAADFYGALYAVDELRLLDHSRFTYVPETPDGGGGNGVPEPLTAATGALALAGLALATTRRRHRA